MPINRPKPTKEEILAAEGKLVPDVIRPGLNVLFCGINPGLYTAAIGFHFGRPGNRFWRALHQGGFTTRLLSPYDVNELVSLGYGITNFIGRATATADTLRPDEYRAGVPALLRKVKRYHPQWVAFLGLGAYRTAFNCPTATVGPQDHLLAHAKVWVLPNPSGLNAHYSGPKLGQAFADFRRALNSA